MPYEIEQNHQGHPDFQTLAISHLKKSGQEQLPYPVGWVTVSRKNLPNDTMAVVSSKAFPQSQLMWEAPKTALANVIAMAVNQSVDTPNGVKSSLFNGVNTLYVMVEPAQSTLLSFIRDTLSQHIVVEEFKQTTDIDNQQIQGLLRQVHQDQPTTVFKLQLDGLLDRSLKGKHYGEQVLALMDKTETGPPKKQ